MDTNLVVKIKNLLAKAESTPFGPERDAFMAKAYVLMEKYAIDEAMLESVGQRDRGKPTEFKTTIEDPYAYEKVELLNYILLLNRGKLIVIDSSRGNGGRGVHIFGFENDLEWVFMLFTSLLLQEISAMKVNERDKPPRDSLRSWRASFFSGFAHGVFMKMKEAQEVSDTEAQADGKGMALVVLKDKEERVRDMVNECYPRLRHGVGKHHGSYAGRQAGTTAGRRANIGQTSVHGSRGSLGSG